MDSLSKDHRAVWRTIRKDLEEIGITANAFEANHDFIFDWFVRAFDTGAFEEQALSNNEEQAATGLESSPPLTRPPPVSAERGPHTINTPVVTHDPTEEISPSGSLTDMDSLHLGTSNAEAENDEVDGVEKKPRVPRVAALIVAATRPKARLLESAKDYHG